MPAQRFSLSPERYSICRLSPEAAVPEWTEGGGFVSVTRTERELSIVCQEVRVPDDVASVSGYRLVELEGPFPLTAVGILHSFTEPLARAGISVFAIGTFDTDYLLLRAVDEENALAVLRLAGHERVR